MSRDEFLREIAKDNGAEGHWLEYRVVFKIDADGALVVDESSLTKSPGEREARK